MRLLVLGGTRFVGRHVASRALERGHDLTLFNRGQTGPALFPEAEHLRGDRVARDLRALAGRTFDVVIDTTGYFPAAVEAATQVLGPSVDYYTFVSSIGVYAYPVAPGTNEAGALVKLSGAPPMEIESDETYGGLKVLCERAVERALRGRGLTVRPALVVGPHDYSERFTYWPRRIAEGGACSPASRRQPVQYIDARDLADWIVDSAERARVGVYNATGPGLTIGRLLYACLELTRSDAHVFWAGDDFLLAHGVHPWEELPLWVPMPHAGFLQVDGSKASTSGLRLRPLRETIADTSGSRASGSAGCCARATVELVVVDETPGALAAAKGL